MTDSPPRQEITYHEYRVIARLLRVHVDAYGDRWKAAVAFGDLIARPNTYDIDLLEVIEGWDGPRLARFSGRADPPLRGELRLYILTPEVFENPALVEDRQERRWVEDLLARVREGYEVIVETSLGRVRQMLEPKPPRRPSLTAPPSGATELDDPYELPYRPRLGHSPAGATQQSAD